MEKPAVGSKWTWEHLPGVARKVDQVIDKPYGSFIVYADTATNGEEVDLRICSLKSWDKATKGKSPYMSKLTVTD